MPAVTDMTGQTVGRLTVKARSGSISGKAAWLAACECGNSTIVQGQHLRTGHVQSCGCLRDEHVGSIKRLRPYEALYRLMSRAATLGNRDYSVSLTYEDFLHFTYTAVCTYCLAPISWSEYSLAKNGGGHNLDRKDNTEGYSLDNVVVCCSRCNMSKGDRFTYDEWLEAMTFLRERNRDANNRTTTG